MVDKYYSLKDFQAYISDLLKKNPLENTSRSQGPVEISSPKALGKTFEPVVPILPSFWGGC